MKIEAWLDTMEGVKVPTTQGLAHADAFFFLIACALHR